MDKYIRDSFLFTMDIAQKELLSETRHLLSLFLESPEENKESIDALKELQMLLYSCYVFCDDGTLIWRDSDLLRDGMHALREYAEKIRQIEIKLAPVQYETRIEAWRKQKDRYVTNIMDYYCGSYQKFHELVIRSDPLYSSEDPPSAPLSPPASAPSAPLPPPVSAPSAPLPPPNHAHFAPPPPCASEFSVDGSDSPRPVSLSKGSKKMSFFEKLFKRFSPQNRKYPNVTGNASRPISCENDDFTTYSHSGMLTDTAPQPIIVDQVFFTTVAPKRFPKGEATNVSILMYENACREIVQMVRDSYETETFIQGTGAKQVKRGTKVRVAIESPETDVKIENSTQEEDWIGQYLEFHFWVLIPKQFQKNQIKLNVRIYTDDIRLTTLEFYIKCVSDSIQQITPVRRDVRTAFVSYARDDIEDVSKVIQGMEKVRPDLELFMDIENLRSGQHWQEILKGEIDRRDLLYLCWSSNAKSSEWVKFEWQYMYRKRGIDYIDPIPLESPQICPPPTELSSLHFDERWLRYRVRRDPSAPVYFYVKDHTNGTIIPSRKSVMLIGRANDADLRLSASSISRHHMKITVTEAGNFQVQDLHSANGSFLDKTNEKITNDGVTVKRGTKLRVADNIIEIL